jgi:hypothetical protein
VIRTAQPARIGDAQLHIDAAMQTPVADQTERFAAVAIEQQVLAQDADFAHRVLEQLGEGRHRNPITAQQFAARRPRADARQPFVHRGCEHPASFVSGLA